MTASSTASGWYASASAAPAVTLGAHNAGPSGIYDIVCTNQLNNDTYTVNASSSTFPAADLSTGANHITCNSYSGADIESTTSASLTVQVDSTVPTATTSSTASGWYANAGAAPAITVSAHNSGPSGLAEIACTNQLNNDTYTTTNSSGTFPAADLSTGTNTVTCNSYSGAYVISAGSTVTVDVDPTVPTVNVSSSASGWYGTANSVPAINVTAADSGPSGISLIICTDALNSAVYSTSSTSGTFPANELGNGQNAISCDSYSGANVQDTSTATVTVELDTTSPTVSYDTTATHGWYAAISSIPTIKADASTGPSGLSTITCTGDGISTQTQTSSGQAVDLTGLSQGTGQISCQATNNAGVTGNSVTYSLHLDSTQPTLSWSTTESETAWYPSMSAVPALNLSAATTGASGVDHINCTGNALLSPVRINAATGTVTPQSMQTGADTVSCIAVSAAGVSSNAITRTIQIDPTAPQLALSGASNSWVSNSQTLTADASASTSASGVQSISCSVDGGTPTVTDADTAAPVISGNGVHQVACDATSGAGVSSTAQTATVKIDSQTPDVDLSVVPADPGQPAGTVAVQVQGSEANALSGIASTSCTLDGQAAAPVNGATQTVDISTGGDHTLDCSATTTAGVSDSPASGDYTVQTDSTQMALQLTGQSTGWQTGNVTLPVAVTGLASSQYQSITCTINGQNATTITGTSGSVPVTSDGVDRVACYATGNNGADGAAVAQTVELDNQQPQASWRAVPTADGENLTLTGSEASPLSGIASEACSVDGGATHTSGSSNLTVQINGNGTHSVACSITTGAGITANVTRQESINIPVPAPVASNAPDPGQWYATNQAVTLKIPTSGPTIASVNCTLNGQASTYQVTGPTLRIPVTAPGGDLKCQNVDSTGAVSAAVDYQVHIDSTAPTGYFTQTGPTHAAVSVSDNAGGSGIATVIVQYQTPGGVWTTVPGSYNAQTGIDSVTLPSALQQPGVTYTLQAIATDNATNHSTITALQNGNPATYSVPAQNNTSASPAPTTAAPTLTGGLYVGTIPPGAKVQVTKREPVYKSKTTTLTVGGKKVIKHTRVRVMRTVHVWQINTAKLATSLTVTYGQAVTLTGTLTAATAAGQPITITQKTATATTTLPQASTNRAGVFSIKLPTGPTRRITYAIDGVSGTVTLAVRGKLTATLTGPAHARVVHLNAHGASGPVRYRIQQQTSHGWSTIASPAPTSPTGTATYKLPVKDANVPASQLRVSVSTQTAWQYITTSTSI